MLPEELHSISVIIPAYCKEVQLHRALQSLKKQFLKPNEVIICDDGSPQPLASTAELFSDSLPIKYIRVNNSGGAAIPRNIAVNNSTSEWVAFLDADDTWTQNKLEVVAQQLDNSVDVVYHKLKISSGDWRKIRRNTVGLGYLDGSTALFDLLSLGNPIPTSGSMIRKDLYIELGGMNTGNLIEDYDFWIRAARNGARFRFIPLVLGEYYTSPDSLSSRDLSCALYETIHRYVPLFYGKEKSQIMSYMEYCSAIRLMQAGNSSEAEYRLTLAKDLRLARYRFSRFLKLLRMRSARLF